jgi:hypothetical protein
VLPVTLAALSTFVITHLPAVIAVAAAEPFQLLTVAVNLLAPAQAAA